MSGQIVRTALRGGTRLGDLYDAVSDDFCGANAIDWDSVGDRKTKAMKKATCVVAEANTFFDRGGAMRIHNDQLMSLFFGDTVFDGYFSLLNKDQLDRNRNSKTVGLFYEYVLQEESVNVLRCELDMDQLAENQSATHIVSQLQLGCRAALLVSVDGPPGTIEDTILRVKETLEMAKAVVEELKPISELPEMECDIVFFTDKTFCNLGRPSTLIECVKFISDMPKRVALGDDVSSDGDLAAHVVPLSYRLISIALVQSMLGIEAAFPGVKQIEGRTFEECKHLFAEMNSVKFDLDSLHHRFLDNQRLFPQSVKESIFNRIRETDAEYSEVKVMLWKNLKMVRRGELTDATVQEFIDKSASLARDIRTFMDVFHFVLEKPKVVDRLKKNGVIVITNESALEYLAAEGETFVFFARMCYAQGRYSSNMKLFENLQQNVCRVLVDMDVAGDDLNSGHYPVNTIWFYKDGELLEDDVLALHMFLQKGSNAVKFVGEYADVQRPIRRVALQMKCPNSGSEHGCSTEMREWSCYSCKTVIEYGSDGCFYCECGQWPVAPAENISFFCNDSCHGFEYLKLGLEGMNEALRSIPKCKEYNVLLIGETGSGKSTWINALINYVSSESLEDAAKYELRYFIPTSFTMEDENKEVRNIVIGDAENDNENFADGESATQDPRSYTFNFGSQLIRLIDVPGIGDVRGAVKDRENFDKILRFVQRIPELHAICILLTPNNSRLTVALKYCFNELLTHLHANAISNITFCFTKTRTTFYRAGESLKTLKTYLEKQNVNIPLVDETMYYFDNEAFRLLCAEKNGVVFNEDERASYSKSWEKSSSEAIRLLQHAVRVVPHKTREMVSLNEIRRVIERLTPALADISTNIQTNIRLIEAKEVESKELVEQGKDLSSRLSVTQTTLVQIPITYPRTVCVSDKCITTSTIPGTTETQRHYTQICHSHCFLEGIEKETYPNQGLMYCAAMDYSRTKCKVCGCSWDIHMHIYYIQEQKAVQVPDTTTQELLQKNADNQTLLASHLRTLCDEKNRLDDAHRKITKFCACFGAFLRANSLVVYNDAMIEYIDYSIGIAKQDESKTRDNRKVERLERFKKEYQEELRILKDESGKVRDITLNEVCRMKDELFNMKNIGVDIRRILELRTKMEDAETGDCVKEMHRDIPRSSLQRFRPMHESEQSRWSVASARNTVFSHGELATFDEMAEHDCNFWTDPSTSASSATQPTISVFPWMSSTRRRGSQGRYY